MIDIKSLECAFDTKAILEDINLHIDKHLTILGANGSGKSTLAKAICSLVEYKGDVLIDDKNVKDLSLIQKAKYISYIPAKLEVYDQFISLEEFVLLGRFPHKQSFLDYSEKDKKITEQTLEFLNISHLNKHSVSALSSGEQQIALIAQALVQQSKIIIFDEPTANLDPHNSKIIAEHIKGLKDFHQIILITHDLHLASYVDTPVVFIKDRNAEYFEDGFFDDAKLQELYGVEFNSLAVKYD